MDGQSVVRVVSMDKDAVRRLVWRALEDKGVAAPPRPVFGRIPNFRGAEAAAARLFETPEWRKARIVKVNPDSPQRPVREKALREGKVLVMPTPRLRRGFLLLRPSSVPPWALRDAATIRGAFRFGVLVKPWDLPEIDLVVQGSVAVNMRGERLGKGEGYAEIEWGLAAEFGKVKLDTPVATTIHDLQLVSYEWPAEPYDLQVDIVLTPTRTLRPEKRREKPRGILWELLSPRKLEEIPVLSEARSFSQRRALSS